MSRVLLLIPTTTYRTQAFMAAAQRLGADVTVASEQSSSVAHLNPTGLITLDFSHPHRAAEQAARFAEHHPIDAVVPVDDQVTVPAAAIAARLGLPANPPESVATAQNKFLLRRRLQTQQLPSPNFQLCALDDDPAELARRVCYPCVLKPLALSAGRGVIRADNPGEFLAAARRLTKILQAEYDESQDNAHHSKADPAPARHYLAETFIPGPEVALEGLLSRGRLRVLALFDKPEPLEGPYFEETILLTPSRLPEPLTRRITETAQAATDAIGLWHGPVHVELRIGADVPRIIEVNPRSIGGLCSRALQFGTGMSLEELIIRHAMDPDWAPPDLQTRPAGVMMIPVPRAGSLEKVDGVKDASAVTNIEGVVISAHVGQQLIPLPEEGMYLGFLFARADTISEVQTALRSAYSRLTFRIR
jgi:biotin carboxylase